MTVHTLPEKTAAKQLTKAEDDLMLAWDLCAVLRGYLNQTRIAECMTAATVVEQIEKRVVKARDRIDAAT